MGISNTMMIAMQEIKGQLDKEAPIKERLKQAMKLAQNHWLVVDEDEQFRSAVGAVAVSASPEEKQKIMAELELLRGLGAATRGVPIDIVELFTRGPKNPYGLNALWMEVKEAQGGERS